MKKVFQSRDLAAGELEDRSAAETDVETWRQREGVKKEDGVDVVVVVVDVEGAWLSDREGLDGDIRRALDDT